jgi:hypothetical protein
MARTRWALKCSVFDGDEERDIVWSAGLTLPPWKSHPSPEYEGSVQALAASYARPIVTRAGSIPWLDSLLRGADRARFWNQLRPHLSGCAVLRLDRWSRLP